MKRIMTRILACTMVLVGILSFNVFAADLWNGSDVDTTWYGDGIADTYTISKAADLAGLAAIVNGTATGIAQDSFKGKTIMLADDLDLAGYEWTPIGRTADGTTNWFEGNFNGQNHEITNLKISGNNRDVGLFGSTRSGKIYDFSIENASVQGYLDVGTVAGTPYTTTYSNITVKGFIQVEGYAYVGGAFGKNAYADLNNVDVISDEGSYVKADSEIYRTYIGGLIGFMGEGDNEIRDCDVKIDVSGSTCDVGGITGILHYGNKIINCTYVGNLELTSADPENAGEIGGLAGTVLTAANQVTSIESSVATVESAIVTQNTGETADVTETLTATGSFYTEEHKTNGEFSVEATVNERTETYSNVVAKIGDTSYTTFEAALAAADDGDTIELRPGTIDNEGAEVAIIKQITIKGADELGSEITNTAFTIQAGPVVFDGLKITGSSYININDGSATDLSVTNCDVNVNVPAKVGNASRAAFIASTNENNSVKLTVTGNKIIVNSSVDSYPAAIFTWARVSDGSAISDNIFGDAENRYKFVTVKTLNAGPGAVIEVSGNMVYGTNAIWYFYAFDFYQNTSRDNVYTVLSEDNIIDAEDVHDTYTIKAICVESNGAGNAMVYDSGTTLNGRNITLSDIDIDNDDSNINVGVNVLLDAQGKILAGSFVKPVSEEYAAQGLVSRQNADGTYTVVAESGIADTIYVKFEKAAQDNDRLYNVILAANDERTINRWTSAELTFNNDSTSAGYEVLAYGNVNYSVDSKDQNKYLFNLNGTGVADESGKSIVIAQIQFTGYGDVWFGIDTEADNAVHATASADNIVTDYIVGGSTSADKTVGELSINDPENSGIIETTLSVPKNTLTVTITFNNNISDNALAYQNMKAVISGGDLTADIEIPFGTNGTPLKDNTYSFTQELTQNTMYRVTVSGEGYRTYSQNIRMTQDKELILWNNVKDQEAEVTEGVSATKNFLAGDIVMDNVINLYDLSAVVSYFGQEGIDTSVASEYARYDLNRDGKIDSKDVAIVLVSWEE